MDNNSINDDEDIIEIPIENNANNKKSRKRKSIEEYMPSPSKVQKTHINDDPIYKSILALSEQLIQNSEVIKINLFDGRFESLNKWIEYSEAEIEIRIESIKIQLDAIEDKLIKKVGSFEYSIFNGGFANVKSKNPLSKIGKLQKLWKFMTKPTEKYLNFKISRGVFKSKNAGVFFKYTPMHSSCYQAVENGHFNDFEYYLNKKYFDTYEIQEFFLIACKNGFMKIAKFLIQKKVNLNLAEIRHERDEEDHDEDCCLYRDPDEDGEYEYDDDECTCGYADEYGDPLEYELPLVIACKFGQFDIMNMLLYNNARVNQTSIYEYTALHEAVRIQRLDIIHLLLENKASINVRDPSGSTPLFKAINANNIAIFEMFMKYKLKYLDEALTVAAKVNAVQIAEKLIATGANVNASMKDGSTSLIYAAEYTNREMVQFLLSNKANVNAKDNNDDTVLMRLCKASKKDRISEVHNILIQHKAELNAKNKTGQTALIIASLYGHFDVVKSLIENGADINIEDNQKENAFLCACARGHNDIVKLLMENKADVNAINLKKETGLIKATMGNLFNTVKEILTNKDVNVNAKDIQSMSALLWAALKGNNNIVDILLERNADIELTGKNGVNAIHLAVEYNVNMVECLLAKGANINARDNNGETALFKACVSGRDDAVEVLLANNADVNIVNNKGKTAWDMVRNLLHVNQKPNNRTRILDMLITANIDIDAKDEAGNTALIAACKRGTGCYVNRILQKNPKLNEKNKKGETALIKAAKNGFMGTVKILLRKGASVDEKDNEGFTALLRAVEKQNQYVVGDLLGSNADVTIENNKKETALKLVQNPAYKNNTIRHMIFKKKK